MQRSPVLAVKTLPPGDGYRVPRAFKVEGGLHYIRGNNAPYFSLTYTAHHKDFPNQCYSGGAGHDEILKHFPRFADLAALHLCDIDGVPMHAVENGWYILAGALGGLGERYHAGNAQYHFPITPPTGKPWQTTEYRAPTADECLAMFARHCRIDIPEARRIRDTVKHAADLRDTAKIHPREILRQELNAMRPRWKAEADACIERHHLRVYGDAWPVAAA